MIVQALINFGIASVFFFFDKKLFSIEFVKVGRLHDLTSKLIAFNNTHQIQERMTNKLKFADDESIFEKRLDIKVNKWDYYLVISLFDEPVSSITLIYN